MSKKNKIVNKIMPIIAIVIITTTFATTVFAYEGNVDSTVTNKNTTRQTCIKTNKQNIEGRRTKKLQQYKEIQAAIDNKNYNAWKAAVSIKETPKNKRLLAVVNASNFNRYAEAKILAQNGNHTELNKLKIELGLNGNRD